MFSANGWDTQWIYRYGPTQTSHYHSKAHECMAVLSGSATIRFGVGDLDDDLEASTYGDKREEGGLELQANTGDVFVLPAGVSHKTFNTVPSSSFQLLTPGDGHSLATDDPSAASDALSKVELSGFTMIGAYPQGSKWDFCSGGENSQDMQAVWSTPKPEKDPALGSSREGLVGLWK